MGGLVDTIAGVSLTPLRRIPVAGGDVLHALKRDEPGFAGFGEAYFSMIDPGAIKGWKRHTRMQMNLVVPTGKIAFLIRDERRDSATAGSVRQVVLGPASADTYMRLTVAPDLWMAFAGLDGQSSLLLNIASLPHDPQEAENRPLDAFDVTLLRALF